MFGLQGRDLGAGLVEFALQGDGHGHGLLVAVLGLEELVGVAACALPLGLQGSVGFRGGFLRGVEGAFEALFGELVGIALAVQGFELADGGVQGVTGEGQVQGLFLGQLGGSLELALEFFVLLDDAGETGLGI